MKAYTVNLVQNYLVSIPARFIFILALILMVIVPSACARDTTATPSSPPSPTFTPTIQPDETPDPAGTAAPAGGVPAQIQAVEDMLQAVASRTPLPTTTPDLIEREIEELIDQTEMAERSFFGLSSDLWINILASLFLFFIGYVLLAILLFKLLDFVVRHTATKFDDQFLSTIERELKWLVVILIGRFTVLRLDIWNNPQVLFLEDVFFILVLSLLALIAIRLIRFAGDWMLEYRIPQTSRHQLAPLVLMFKRLGYLIAILIALSAFLHHLGVNTTWIAGFILLFGIIVAFGAREVVGDLASGIIILMDPPYRVGDDLFIQEINDWGRVVEIGLRNTQLRTLDDRTIVIPNEQMGKNQIINYSYPNSTYRIHTDISLAYESDMALARRVIEESVRGVEASSWRNQSTPIYWNLLMPAVSFVSCGG